MLPKDYFHGVGSGYVQERFYGASPPWLKRFLNLTINQGCSMAGTASPDLFGI